LEGIVIAHGDCLVVLPTLNAESVDAAVTDPPYGIGFMGREWDTFKPGSGKARRLMHPRERAAAKVVSENPNVHGRHRSPALSPSQIDYDYSAAGLRAFQEWTQGWAREVLRVLKPGAYVLVCGAPRSFHRMACGVEDAGFEIRDTISWLFGSGFPKSLNLGDGRGTALKPAWEPIVVARKPFKGSVAANVAQHGTGTINVDGCRIETAGPRDFKDSKDTNQGRWPANVALDEEAAAQLDEQSGDLASGANPTRRGSDKFRGIYGAFKGQTDFQAARGFNVGGASRFYYVAKPSREERDAGCHDLIPRQRDESRKAGNPGGDNPRNRGLQPRGNYHPTVKPLSLMRWLVRLVTPPGGLVLDPFTGSGTTGMACAAEGFQFIGIEREAEYVEIAERRIASIAPLFTNASGSVA